MNLIFDINNAFYKSYSVYMNIYGAQKEISEKLLFNKFMTDFFYSIRLFSDRNKVDKVICCFDSKHSFRKEFFSKYKSNRSQVKDDGFYNVLDYLCDYLEIEGFIVYKVLGLEADDLIGLNANYYKDELNCILSNDEDIRQLLDEKTFVYNNQSKNKTLYFDATQNCPQLAQFQINFAKWKIIFQNPHWVLFKKIILGCESDMVPKLLKGRVGEKTLKKKIYDKIFFDNQNITPLYLQHLCDTIKQKLHGQDKLYVNHLITNYRLVNLCSNECHPADIKAEWRNQLNGRKFTYRGNYQL